MKMTCLRQTLVEAVLNVQKAVSTKSCLAALEGILISTKENSLSLCGYDLELGIMTEIPATIEQPGQIVINAKLFSEIIRKAPADTITISVDEKLIATITSAPAEFSLVGISHEDFPEIPTLSDAETLSLDCETLKGMIRQTLFATSETDVKPINTGTLFEVSETELKLISVDGFRLALRKEALAGGKEIRFVVPGKTLNEVLKILPDAEGAKIQISVGKKHIIFYIESYFVISRLLEGEFLDYTAAIPPSHATAVVVNVKSMIESIDRVSLVVTDRLKSPVRCSFANNFARVFCITTVGKASDELPISMQGDALEIGFNNRYLIDALKNTECDEVKVLLNGPLSPIKIVPKEGDAFVFLVLPVRLKAVDE